MVIDAQRAMVSVRTAQPPGSCSWQQARMHPKIVVQHPRKLLIRIRMAIASGATIPVNERFAEGRHWGQAGFPRMTGVMHTTDFGSFERTGNIDPTETLAAAEVFRKILDLDRREL
jgi:hypothetical protein